MRSFTGKPSTRLARVAGEWGGDGLTCSSRLTPPECKGGIAGGPEGPPLRAARDPANRGGELPLEPGIHPRAGEVPEGVVIHTAAAL